LCVIETGKSDFTASKSSASCCAIVDIVKKKSDGFYTAALRVMTLHYYQQLVSKLCFAE
jgi:hypothetical protein